MCGEGGGGWQNGVFLEKRYLIYSGSLGKTWPSLNLKYDTPEANYIPSLLFFVTGRNEKEKRGKKWLQEKKRTTIGR